MELKIILGHNQNSYQEMFEGLVEPIHDTLKGHQDYMDSNIVLHSGFNNSSLPECTIFILVDECMDKKLISEAINKAVDSFINNFER